MSEAHQQFSLEDGARVSGMSIKEIWTRQVSVGGVAGPLEVEAYLLGLLRPDDHQHDVLAQSLNEYFMEQGGDHPVRYSDG